MNRTRRIVIALGVIALLVVGALLLVNLDEVRRTTARAVDSLIRNAEDWTRDQITRIANDHLGVEFEFDRFSLESSSVALLHGVRLRDEDEVFMRIDSMRLTFAELPRFGSPLRIASIEAIAPAARLLVREDGTLLGWRRLIDSDGGSKDEDGGSTRLSDVFDIRSIAVIDGSIEYDPRDDSSPMRFDELMLKLDAAPGAEPGWHMLMVRIDRSPVLRFEINGRMNLDEAIIEIARGRVRAELGPAQYAILPPQIQSYFATHEIGGVLSIDGSGIIPLGSGRDIALAGGLEAIDTHIAWANVRLPAERITASWELSGAALSLRSIDAALLDGGMRGEARVYLDNRRQAAGEFTGRGLHLQRTVREVSGDPSTSLAGRLDFNLRTVLPLEAAALDGMAASGNINIREGRLVRLPVVSDLIRILGGNILRTGSDRLETRFALEADRPREVILRDLNIVSAAIAARGEGSVFFDRRVDLQLNAGPLERVQDLLGGLGDLVGSITDRLMKYHITGTLDDTKVNIRPLGIGGGR